MTVFHSAYEQPQSLGQRLGTGLGQGMGQAFSKQAELSLQQKMQALEDQRKMDLNRKAIEAARPINRNAASSLADRMGLLDEEKNSFVNMFQDMEPKEQMGALKNISEAQMLSRYMQGMPQGVNNQNINNQNIPPASYGNQQFFADQGLPIEKGVIPPTQLERQRNLSPTQAQTPSQQRQEKLGKFSFNQGELPPVTQQPLAIGPLAKTAEIENQKNLLNRAENKVYAEKYNVSVIEDQIDKLRQARKIIKESHPSASWIRNALTKISESDEKGLEELIKGPAQTKIAHLMRQFLKPKDLGGSNPSTREVLMSTARTISGMKPEEAELYILDEMEKALSRDRTRAELSNQLRKRDPYMDPSTMQEVVEKKVNELYPYTKSEGEKAEYELLPSPPGTPVTKEDVEAARKIWGDDIEVISANLERLGRVVPK